MQTHTLHSGSVAWRRLFACLLLASWGMAGQAGADTLIYDFDDGTFQGWELVVPDGSPFPDDSDVSWIPSAEAIDIGDGFTLLPATSGTHRVVPDPWSNRDCLGGLFCYTQILRSPEFFLDDSGPVLIDMIGGGAQGNQPFDPVLHEPPAEMEDLPDFKDSQGLQGFALRDVETGAYVLHGFSIGENDGKARPDDPPHRASWDTVALSQEDLAARANDGRRYQIDIFDSYLGGWGWIGFDTVRIPGRSAAAAPGDFNGDGQLTADDINRLSEAVRDEQHPPAFDLNGDGLVNQADRGVWVDTLRQTYFGDSNLDGEFSSSDFVQVFQAGEYEDALAENSRWETGDWNGDAEFDSTDFVIAFQAGGFEQGPRQAVAAVPEPSACGLIGGLLLLSSGWLRRIGRQSGPK